MTAIFLDYETIKASKRNDPNNPITAAFISLAQAITESHTHSHSNEADAEAVFVFGSITNRKLDTERAIKIQQHRANGKQIYSLDSAFFSTYMRRFENSSETHRFRIGKGDCVGSEAFELKRSSNSKKFDMYRRAFDFKPQKPKADNDLPIMFILQTERGWQYNDELPYKDYARKVLTHIRALTDRKVILRAHPNHGREPLEYIADGFDNMDFQYGERARSSIIDDLYDVGAVITHSSSAAVESLVEGIPTFALDERCIAYDVCENDLSKINRLEDYNWIGIKQKFSDWANCSFHINELANPQRLDIIMEQYK